MDWSPTDYGLLASALAAQYADVESTKRAIKKGGREDNPLIGKNPSGQDLDHAGIAAALAAAMGANYLQGNVRRAFLGGVTGLETGLAQNNDTETQKTRGTALTRNALPAALAAAGALGGYLLPSGSNLTVAPTLQAEDEKGKTKLNPAINFQYKW
jgi:hypothetical protein